MTTYKFYLKWLTLWLLTWGISQWLWGGDPLKATPVPGTILIIFLIALVLAFALFSRELKIWLSKISFQEILIILVSIGLFSLFNERLLLSSILTSVHVLFQQFMIAVLVLMDPTEKFTISLKKVLILFGGTHLLLAIFMSWYWTLFFTILASAVAILFAFLTRRVKYGVTISYLIHLGFYFVLFNFL